LRGSRQNVRAIRRLKERINSGVENAESVSPRETPDMKSSIQCARNCVKYVGHNEDETSKDYSVTYLPFILLIKVSRVFHDSMIRQLLEGLLPRESQNFPQRHGECPDVTLARVSSLRKNKRVRKYRECLSLVHSFGHFGRCIFRYVYFTVPNRKQTFFCDETSMITFVTLISNSSKLQKSIERARDPHSLRRPNVWARGNNLWKLYAPSSFPKFNRATRLSPSFTERCKAVTRFYFSLCIDDSILSTLIAYDCVE